MSTQNEASNTQHPLPGTFAEPPAFDQGAPPAGYAIAAEPAEVEAKSEEATQGRIESTRKERNEVQKSTRTKARKIGSELLSKNPNPTMAAAKPARVKRTRTQPAEEVKNEAEAGGKPKRASSRKTAKVVEAPALAEPAGGEIPPITPAAIEFLGNQDTTAADVLKLAPESLAFVQYHFKYLQQLEANSQLTNAYLIANARPASPAFQHFADALAKHGNRERSHAVVQAAAEVPEPDQRQQTSIAIPSYRQKVPTTSAYPPVDAQLRKRELNSGMSAIQTRASEPTQDDHTRANRVIGTAHILMSAPINELTPKEAADLVANDVEELRAIKEVAAWRLALNAMVESGFAQPRYQAEFAKQAPELVEQTNQAHKATKADWDLTNEVSSTLSYLADAEKPLTKDETVIVARMTIQAIRAIKNQQYRQEALAFSYQIGHWQPMYQEEFARQAPDLVAPAEAAYKAEEARTTPSRGIFQGLENSIERSPMQRVSAPSLDSSAARAPSEHQTTDAKNSAEQLASSATQADKVVPDSIPHPSLGRRLGIVLADVTDWASRWLLGQQEERPAPASDVRASLNKSAAVPASVDDKSTVVPESVARRFLKIERDYYFQDRTLAFSDRGSKLATRGSNPKVVRSLVEIAKARGWETITVIGTEDFRRSAWMEATQSGLTVIGYKPTALDLADLANRPANNTVEKGAVQSKSSAPTKPTAQQPVAQTNPAEPVTAHQTETKEPASGSLRPDPKLTAKAKAFQEEKPAFVVKKYPDLAAAYGIVAAAKAFASEKLTEAGRNEFIEIAKRHMVEKIMAGQQIRGPKIYVAPTTTIAVSGQTKTAVQVDQGKSPRAKAVERER